MVAAWHVDGLQQAGLQGSGQLPAVGAVALALAFLVAGGDVRRIGDDVAYAVFLDEDAVGFEAAEAGLVHAADLGVRIVPAELPGNHPCVRRGGEGGDLASAVPDAYGPCVLVDVKTAENDLTNEGWDGTFAHG